jgi:hypothetical protein
MKKKKQPIEEYKEFIEVCGQVFAMYATCSSDTKRCFVAASYDKDKSETPCIVLFRGNSSDLHAIKAFLEARDEVLGDNDPGSLMLSRLGLDKVNKES